jgi:hypothetical protein
MGMSAWMRTRGGAEDMRTPEQRADHEGAIEASDIWKWLIPKLPAPNGTSRSGPCNQGWYFMFPKTYEAVLAERQAPQFGSHCYLAREAR